jgi:hypothetical protein
MTTQYLSVFVGKDKPPILSTTFIQMLESYKAWRGHGTGNGYKEPLTDMLQIAVQNHQQYCEDYLLDGDLKSLALKTADISKSFWMSLVAYLEDKYSLLESFKLVVKHVLLLLSNQIIQICDNIFEHRSNASNVDLENMGATAAQFAGISSSNWLHERVPEGKILPSSGYQQHFRVLPHPTHGRSVSPWPQVYHRCAELKSQSY